MPRFAVSQRWLYVFVGALALAGPPLLLRAEPANWSAVQSIVANMPQPERDRLDRNTKDYLAISEDQREQYRRLHAALEDDDANNNGKLTATMEGYYAWLGSNPAYDRQTLRKSTGPDQRIAEVQRIVKQRDEQASNRRSRRSKWWLQDAHELAPEQLSTLMAKLENRVPMNAEDSKRLRTADGNEKTGVARYFTLFGIMRHHNYKLDQVLEKSNINEMLEEVPGLTMPPGFAAAPEDVRRRQFLGMIVGNVLKEYESEVRSKSPSTEDLQRLVANWQGDPKELDRILEEEPSDFRSELEREFAKQSNSLDMRDLMEVLPPRGSGWWPRFGMNGGRGGPFRGGRDGPRFGRPGDGSGPPPDEERRPPPDGERPPRREDDRPLPPVNPAPMP